MLNGQLTLIVLNFNAYDIRGTYSKWTGDLSALNGVAVNGAALQGAASGAPVSVVPIYQRT